MIISHKHKFIFIKTRKTGGSSLEMVLSTLCGDDDIITPFGSPEDEKERDLSKFRAPQNYGYSRSELLRQRRIKPLLFNRRVAKFREHSRAIDVRKLVGDPIWRDYFTFSMTRNPFDRALSLYFWRKSRGLCGDDIEQCLIDNCPSLMENWRILTDRDQVCVDDVVRYETLDEDLQRVGNRIGVGDALATGMRDVRLKGSHRPKGSAGRPVLSADAKTLIRLLCGREMAAFGYEMPAA